MRLLFVLLLPLAVCLLCPQSTFCGNLNIIGVSGSSCALLHPPYVTISVEGCDYTDNYSYCSFDLVMKKYLEVMEGTQFSMNCSKWNTTEMHEGYRNRTNDLAENQDTYKQQRLKTGTHPKLCDTDADCELDNGQYAECLCGGFSQSYCALSLGDPFMIPMYPRAVAGDFLQVDYFLSYQKAFAYQYSKIGCDILFVEHQLVMEAEAVLKTIKYPDPYEIAGWMSAAVTLVGLF